MKITVIGAGGAFATADDRGHSSFLIEHADRRILVDCGTAVPLALQRLKIPLNTITDVVVTHTHADHIGGLEQLLYAHKFLPPFVEPRTRPKLWTSWDVSEELEKALHAMRYDNGDGIFESILEEYFDMDDFDGTLDFYDHIPAWDGLELGFWEVKHVGEMPAISVRIGPLLISGDTNHPSVDWADNLEEEEHPKMIFHEVEFSETPTGVHTPIAHLAGVYPDGWKAKTWLYHCASQAEVPEGFAGILEPGQTFELEV